MRANHKRFEAFTVGTRELVYGRRNYTLETDSIITNIRFPAGNA